MTEKTYYLKQASDLIEMRQARFRHLSSDHPHDVCAVARSKDELRGMLVSVKMDPDTVDWESIPGEAPT